MWIFLLLHPLWVCIGQFLGASLVVGNLLSLNPLFLFRPAFPCLLPVDFGFAFLEFLMKLAFCLSNKKKKIKVYGKWI